MRCPSSVTTATAVNWPVAARAPDPASVVPRWGAGDRRFRLSSGIAPRMSIPPRPGGASCANAGAANANSAAPAMRRIERPTGVDAALMTSLLQPPIRCPFSMGILLADFGIDAMAVEQKSPYSHCTSRRSAIAKRLENKAASEATNTCMSQPVLDFLLSRRSSKAALLTAPGPSPQEIETILTAATRVPDHKSVRPWRFILFEGEARAAFGQILAEVCRVEETEPPSPVRLETERGRLLRAPLVIVAVSRTREVAGAPEWEQILSCGAACFNLCLAANAMGYGTSWVTEWYSYSATVRAKLGLAQDERVAGFIYIGTPKERLPDRERPALAAVVSRWPDKPM